MSDWRTIVAAALRAPSPHNVQPWRVRIHSEREADLLLEKARTLPEEDVTGSFILLTMGLFLEALSWMAAHRGARLTYEMVHAPDWYRAGHLALRDEPLLPFARMRLDPGPVDPPPFDEATFRARRTSRLHYAADPIGADVAGALNAMATPFDQRYGQTTAPRTIETLLGWNIDAVFEDLNARGYHDEITGWFRYDDRASRATRDGLDARCMNQRPYEMWLAARAPWLLRTPGVRHVFAARYRSQIGPVATMGWIAGGFWKSEEAFRAGRFLLHFWCALTAHGLVMHPYGNLVTNRPIAAKAASLLGADDIWLIFKVGRSALPPESHRRSIDEVLV